MTESSPSVIFLRKCTIFWYQTIGKANKGITFSPSSDEEGGFAEGKDGRRENMQLFMMSNSMLNKGKNERV